jgi:hypothetical protein
VNWGAPWLWQSDSAERIFSNSEARWRQPMKPRNAKVRSIAIDASVQVLWHALSNDLHVRTCCLLGLFVDDAMPTGCDVLDSDMQRASNILFLLARQSLRSHASR